MAASARGSRHAHTRASSRQLRIISCREDSMPSNTMQFLCFQMFQQHKKRKMEPCCSGMALGIVPGSGGCWPLRAHPAWHPPVAIGTPPLGSWRWYGLPFPSGCCTARRWHQLEEAPPFFPFPSHLLLGWFPRQCLSSLDSQSPILQLDPSRLRLLTWFSHNNSECFGTCKLNIFYNIHRKRYVSYIKKRLQKD
jgi:hypothetical protein